MKVPSNFNANATKKISSLEEAIAGNFSKEQSQKINESVAIQPAVTETAAKKKKKKSLQKQSPAGKSKKNSSCQCQKAKGRFIRPSAPCRTSP